jgi:hypothetical protein
MSVYVDQASNPLGRMKMCHMMADTLEELHAMADKLGMKREWFQNDSDHPHYDLSQSKRQLAIQFGAVEVDSRQLVELVRKWRKSRMNTVQETEFLYEWRTDRADGQLPDEWFAHRILKRTKQFVFVEYKIGANHPSRQTMRLNRAKLEANGEIYWSHGTWCICFYTEEGKKRKDDRRATYSGYVPDCLSFFGLTWDATPADVHNAYRAAVMQNHPDTGGSHEAFLKLQEHYKAALDIARV